MIRENYYPLCGAWDGIGSTVVGGVTGGLFNWLTNKDNIKAQKEINAQNIEAAAQARLENFEYNERAANAADARLRQQTQDFWNMYNSPQAQLNSRIKGLEENDISKTLAFMEGSGAGGSGSASTSMAQGGGASGIGAPNLNAYQKNPILTAAEGMQLGMMAAQIEKTKAETEDIKGNTPGAQASITQMLADAGLKNAAKQLTATQTTWQELQNSIGKDTKEFTIRQVEALARETEFKSTLAMYEALNSEQDLTLKQETFDANIAVAQLEVGSLIADIFLKQAQTDHEKQMIKQSEAQIKTWATQCLYLQKEYLLDVQNSKSLRDLQDAQKKYTNQMEELAPKELKTKQWQIGIGAATSVLNTIGNALIFKGMGAAGMVGKAANAGSQTISELWGLF